MKSPAGKTYVKYNYISFVLIVLLVIVYDFLYKKYIYTDYTILEAFREQYPEQIANNILHQYQALKNFNYIIIPLIFLIKTSFLALCLDVVSRLDNIDKRMEVKYPYNQLYFVFIISEWVSVGYYVIRLLWFGLFQTDYTYENLIDFNVLSLYDLFSGNFKIITILSYPLKSLNILELLYYMTLIISMKYTLKIEWKRSIYYALLSYGLVMVLIYFIVAYLTFNIQ